MHNNTKLNETLDVDYNEEEDDAYDDDQGPFGRKEFADVAFDCIREQVGSPVSDATDNYGYPMPVKQAAKAEAMKDARHQRRQKQSAIQYENKLS